MTGRVSDERLRDAANLDQTVHGEIAAELLVARHRIAQAAEALIGTLCRQYFTGCAYASAKPPRKKWCGRCLALDILSEATP